MRVVGIDFYNFTLTGEGVTKTLTGMRVDTINIPCVLIDNSSGEGIAGTLDSNYWKGQGERQGTEREYVVVGISRNDSGSSDSEDY